MNPQGNQQQVNPLSNPYINPLMNPGQQKNPQQAQFSQNQTNQQGGQQTAPLQAIMQSLASRQMSTDPRYASQVNPNPPSPANSIQDPGILGIAGAKATQNNQTQVMPVNQPTQLQPPPQNPIVGAVSNLISGSGTNMRAMYSQLMGIMGDNSPQGQIGNAIADPSYAGYCLQWVDDQQGNKNRQPTAYADYQANLANGNVATQGVPPKGARVYFAPDSSNSNYGHVGISNGDGSFTSATYNGIQTFSLQNWEQYTGQQYLGYAMSSQ